MFITKKLHLINEVSKKIVEFEEFDILLYEFIVKMI